MTPELTRCRNCQALTRAVAWPGIQGKVCPIRLKAMGPQLRQSTVKKSARIRKRREVQERKRRKIYARDGERCVHCGCDDEKLLTIDHVIPRSRGGSERLTNLQTLCKDCNEEKGDSMVEAALSIMTQVDTRALPTVNPCPSRDEWDAIRGALTA